MKDKKITSEEADKIIADNLHVKHRWQHLVAKYRGQWYDVRGMSKQEMATGITKIHGYMVAPDCII